MPLKSPPVSPELVVKGSKADTEILGCHGGVLGRVGDRCVRERTSSWQLFSPTRLGELGAYARFAKGVSADYPSRMIFEQLLLFGILVGALVLFVWGRWRYDVVALLALLAATVTGPGSCPGWATGSQLRFWL
jgi:hypothetical protein